MCGALDLPFNLANGKGFISNDNDNYFSFNNILVIIIVFFFFISHLVQGTQYGYNLVDLTSASNKVIVSPYKPSTPPDSRQP